ncbi:hypothetical protein [Actinomadura sp. BRA 177]|uniref:hypothetical protein n=1 Tax=Actinomadura sp. BRA 177 TaxID=2745202 RepID=UPI0015950FE6|nr:hypothetical protein [Actinomadura sp. BRA 177]NVI86389.1 hypothetical protein [Actinomadura sp. BRA 177]NVI86390.1 hypothetical protein [Actinomadura sp. BRA 177]
MPTPRGVGNWIGVYVGVFAYAAVSFGVGEALLGFGKLAEPTDEEYTAEDGLQEAAEKSAEHKADAKKAARGHPQEKPAS